MREFVANHFELVLCFLILLGRVGDIVSTYLVTPTLALEANSLVRKLKWKFALVTLLFCFVPFFNTALALMILVPSLLVTASNASKIWVVRAIGEREYLELLISAARKTRPIHAYLCVLVPASFIALAGGILVFLSPDETRDWGFWFGWGIVVYGFAILTHGFSFTRRLFKAASATELLFK